MLEMYRIMYRASYGETYTHSHADDLGITVRTLISMGYMITGIVVIDPSDINKGS